MAIDLEKGGKGSLKEIVSVVRTFAKFRPFTIELEDGTRRSFDSLLFANIAEMAKYATLSETGPPDDGRFEVIMLPHTAMTQRIRPGLSASSPQRGGSLSLTVRHAAPSVDDYRAVERAMLVAGFIGLFHNESSKPLGRLIALLLVVAAMVAGLGLLF